MVWLFAVAAGATGELKLDVMGEMGAGAKTQAEVIAPDGKVVATVSAVAAVHITDQCAFDRY